jgi:hypothetical protein
MLVCVFLFGYQSGIKLQIISLMFFLFLQEIKVDEYYILKVCVLIKVSAIDV